jgi:hypothetical protein
VQKKREEGKYVKKKKGEKGDERRSTRSKVVKVKVLNLDLLSKDLEMKLGSIIKEYEAFSFPNF